MKKLTTKTYSAYLSELVLTAVLKAEHEHIITVIPVHNVTDLVAVTGALNELRFDFPDADKVDVELLSIH
jgi:hypothetical protein|tara:strand:- start:2400 stop:2609 length:210 start_codon:yes stop_codon:yes gene_type:complete